MPNEDGLYTGVDKWRRVLNLVIFEDHARFYAVPANAFVQCRALAAVKLPPGVGIIDGVLYGKEIPGAACAGPRQHARGAFAGCVRLARVALPESLTCIGSGAFCGCVSLACAALPRRLQRIGRGAFAGCGALASLAFPPGLSEIGCYAFYGCGGLQSLDLPPLLERVESYTFCGCRGLRRIAFPATLMEIEAMSFYRCTGLAAVRLPPALAAVGCNAFNGCRELASVTFASPVRVGSCAFCECARLRSVAVLRGTVVEAPVFPLHCEVLEIGVAAER